MNELIKDDYENINNEPVAYNDNNKVEGNDRIPSVNKNKSVDNLVAENHAPYTENHAPYTENIAPATENHAPYTENHAPYTENHAPATAKYSPVKIRSDQVRGRSLVLPQPDLEQFSKAENSDKKTEKIAVMEESEENLSDHEVERVSEIDFVIDFSVSEPHLDFNIKIGIFIGVSLSILTITVLVVVMRRRKGRSAKLVIDEDQSTTDSQAVFSRPMKINSSIIQEQFGYNAGKSSCYPCDDLHSLDNDSFLTSLETISLKDKFTWD